MRLIVITGLMMIVPPPTLSAALAVTVIRADRILDVTSGRTLEGGRIIIDGNRITSVGSDVPVPATATIKSLPGMTVLPGLIDSHVHVCLTPDYQQRNPVLYKTNPYRALEALKGARENLMAGFTTLRDLDNEGADMSDIAVRDAFRDGLFEGPRLVVSGWALSITAGHMNLTGLRPSVDRRLEQLAIMADDRNAMVSAVRDQVKAGVDFIKIYATGTLRHIDRKTMESISQFSLEEIRIMVEEAARWRVDVAAHAYGGEGAYNAVAGGVRSIEHGMFLDDRTLDLMVERGTFWVPTMSVYLPDDSTPPGDIPFRERIVAGHRDTFRRAVSKKVRIAFGTDAGSIPHGTGFDELKRMADYGMTPIQVIRSATTEGAALLRRDHELGRIEAGYLADIIAVEGNPLSDIGALARVAFVMADGRVVRDDVTPRARASGTP